MAISKVRIDKWLWSVRIYKTRTLATTACKKSNVKINDKAVKPSYLLTVGKEVQVHKNGYNLVYQVDKLIGKRVGAPIAAECYTDLTPADELSKYDDWFVGKAKPEVREKGTGRPTKRERRELDEFKGTIIFGDEEE